MKRYLPLFCLILPLSALAVTWTPVTTTENLLISVDLSSVSKVEIQGYGQYRKVWIKQIFRKEDPVISIGDYSYALFWLDCKNDSYIKKSLKIYGKDGNLQHSIPYTNPIVEYITPDSVMTAIARKVCSIKL